jgi:hypothetical protein
MGHTINPHGDWSTFSGDLESRKNPIEVCVKVPVIVHCPVPAVASEQAVAPSPQVTR